MPAVDPNKAPPVMLFFRDLHRPVDLQRARLLDIKSHLEKLTEDVLIQGVFALAVSGLETMLLDVYRCFVLAVPSALQITEDKVGRSILASRRLSQALITRRIEQHVHEVAYRRFTSVLRQILKTLNVEKPTLDEDLVERITEAKETRNLLLHANLRVNSTYIERAGRKARATKEKLNSSLPLDRDYVMAAVNDTQTFVDEISSRLHAAYGTRTRIRAFRDLWDYLFESPIMEFDDYWYLNDDEDRITGFKTSDWEDRLASSEKMFLGVLRRHTSLKYDPVVPVNMNSLDRHRQDQMLYLLELLAARHF